MVKITNFKKIKTVCDLTSYLEDPKRDKEFFYHYTTIDRLELILSNRYFVFSCLNEMNDGHEAKNANSNFQGNAFVGSFSRADNEVMAMWGMYAIPWEMGVRIGIHKTLFRKWIRETKTVFEIDNEGLKNEFLVDKNQKKINAVCYYDKLNHKLDWSNRRLYLTRVKNLHDPDSIDQLNGYIKHKTWSYEEEIRVLIRINSGYLVKRIAIPIPNYVLDDIRIVLGPCFDRSQNPDKGIQQTISEFTDMITPKKVCDFCSRQFAYSPKGRNQQ